MDGADASRPVVPTAADQAADAAVPGVRRPMTVGIYIPCYNGAAHIRFTIASLLAQTRKPDVIALIDDGSTDDSYEIAKSFPIKVVRHERNLGLGAARNTGIMYLRTDIIGSVDADTFVEPDWVARLASILERNPRVMGVAGRLNEWEDGTLPDRWRAKHMRQHWGDKRGVNPRFLFGANTMYRRGHLVQVKGYHPAFRTNGEDYDLSRKLMKAFPGDMLFYEPAAVVWHLRRDTRASLYQTQWKYLLFPRQIYQPYKSWTEMLAHTHGYMVRHIWRDKVLRDLKDRDFRSALFSLGALFAVVHKQIRFHIAEAPNRARRARAQREADAQAAKAPASGSAADAPPAVVADPDGTTGAAPPVPTAAPTTPVS